MSKTTLTKTKFFEANLLTSRNSNGIRQVSHGAPCWAPPLFPPQGRLSLTAEQLEHNHWKIREEERLHRRQFVAMKATPCCKSLHMSLFFDGTNNNDKHDSEMANPPHPSNIAKLYHASAPNDKKAMQEGFYAYYIPGVGTPFPEINTFDYYSNGLSFAEGGEGRISWGLLQLCNTLFHVVTEDMLPLSLLRKTHRLMSTSFSESMVGGYDPQKPLFDLLTSLKLPQRVAAHRPQLLTFKLFVYGFSRGAAQARTFVYWVNSFLQYLHDKDPKAHPKGTICGLPLSIEFLGLFDTVAAVGLANVVPAFTGHQGWAWGTQQLPRSNLVKTCYQFIASHEQRQSFAVESLRTPDGSYPAHCVEVVYPGMHSDVGGGYPPNDQGKARNGSVELLSQITLHDMYAAAIEAGAPLAIRSDILALYPAISKHYPFRVMSEINLTEFSLHPDLIERFNTWVQTTLSATHANDSTERTQCYQPRRFIYDAIEAVLERQLILLTAWRIGRFASPLYSPANLTHQPFFAHAPQHAMILAQPYEAAFKTQANKALAEEFHQVDSHANHIKKLRKLEKSRQSKIDEWMPSNIGSPLFDATNARGQHWEAALEFSADYAGTPRPKPLIDFHVTTQQECNALLSYKTYDNPYDTYSPEACSTFLDTSYPLMVASITTVLQGLDNHVSNIAYAITSQEEKREYLSLKEHATALYREVFAAPLKSGQCDDVELARIIALFDDHIHDSRAWFMHSESGVREPFSSYFLSRMIYFGDHWNKAMQLIINGDVVYGVTAAVKQPVFYYKPTEGLILIDKSTGQEAAIDVSQRPQVSNTIMQQIKSIQKRRAENAHQTMMDSLKELLLTLA